RILRIEHRMIRAGCIDIFTPKLGKWSIKEDVMIPLLHLDQFEGRIPRSCDGDRTRDKR
ncbi:MAG: hypothetical protein L6R42_006768, partial [Xanthoria sp. 1 TBL-2021]